MKVPKDTPTRPATDLVKGAIFSILENMTDDWWEVDVNTGRVRGERTRQVYAMGSKIKVRIAEVDLSARQLGLRLAEDRKRPVAPREVKRAPHRKVAPISRPGRGKARKPRGRFRRRR